MKSIKNINSISETLSKGMLGRRDLLEPTVWTTGLQERMGLDSLMNNSLSEMVSNISSLSTSMDWTTSLQETMGLNSPINNSLSEDVSNMSSLLASIALDRSLKDSMGLNSPINSSLSEKVPNTSSLSASIALDRGLKDSMGLNSLMNNSLSEGLSNMSSISQTMLLDRRLKEAMGLHNPMNNSLSELMENISSLSASVGWVTNLQETMGLNNLTSESLSQLMRDVAEISNLNSAYKSNLNVGVSDIFQVDNSINDMRETLSIHGEYYFNKEDIDEFNKAINIKEKEVANGEVNKVQIFMIYLLLNLLLSTIMVCMRNGLNEIDIEFVKQIVYDMITNIIMNQLSLSNVTETIKKANDIKY